MLKETSARGSGAVSAAGRAGRWRRPSAAAVVVTCCAVLGLLLRGYQLARPGFLLGVTEYDDGVMFGNALQLVSGVIPYRDFQMVQPPGSLLILAPTALLARVIGTAQGLAVERVLTVAADVANIVLIGVLVRRRGALAAAIACGVYAVYPDALPADHTFMLEPWLNLCCLAGAVLLFGGGRLPGTARLAWAGVAFGFGATVKIWAAVPLAIAIGIVLVAGFRAAPSLVPTSARDLRARLRPTAALAGGAAAGQGIPLLPFLVMAPGGLVRGVLISQLARNVGGKRDPLGRLVDLAGLQVYPHKLPNEAVLAGFALVMLACYAWAYLGRRGRSRAGQDDPGWLDVYALAGAVAITAMLLWPSLYYPHYGAFDGPFLGLAVALPVGLLTTGRSPGQGAERRGPAEADTDGPGTGTPVRAARAPLATGVTAVLAVVVALGLALATEVQLRWESHWSGIQVTGVDRLIPPGACVLTNHASYTVATDRFYSADPGCPAMVDSFGTLFAMTDGGSIVSPPSELRPVRELWMSSLEHAQYFWITEDTTNQIPWDPQLLGYFHAHFRLIDLGYTIRRDRPATPEPGLYLRT